MRSLSLGSAALIAFGLAGCASSEVAYFNPQANQQEIMRDGIPALISKQKDSIVMVSPAFRQMNAGSRPVFTVAATDLSANPIELAVSDISVNQIADTGAVKPLPVIPYEQLVSEERTRQVVGALLVGVAAGANSYSASRAGYGSVSGTVYTPYGSRFVTANYYSPTAAAIAQGNAAAENDAMIANTVAAGQRNLAALQNTVLKDNTIMPGQWVGGRVYFTAPVGDTGRPKRYEIAITLGGDKHVFDVTQGPAKK